MIKMTFRFLLIMSFFAMQSCFKVKDYMSTSKPIQHTIFDGLLKKHVNTEGSVNYKGFMADSILFNSYLKSLSQNHPNEQNWSKNERLAYWLNAYNAFTIKLITQYYPIKSIKDIKKGIPFVSDTWTINFIKIEGKTYNLNDIEHGIVRPKFKDPRVHFALNCASKGCPPLLNAAFVAEKLDLQLEAQAKAFINDGNRNKIHSSQKADLSKIFTWFAADFKKVAPSVVTFINRYSSIRLDEKADLNYQEYDWSLNEMESFNLKSVEESKPAIPEKLIEKEKNIEEKKDNIPAPLPTQTASINTVSDTSEPVKAPLPTASKPIEKTPIKMDTKPNHGLFNELLKIYVSNEGKVNYKGLKNNKAQLEAYLRELETKIIQEDWSKEEKLAYWINIYNANTLKLILNYYPIKSITDLDGGKTWDVKRITVGGKKYSLNNIENDIIRPQFKDARIHFAVNCAAKSCPPLANQAFTAENLNALLDTRTRLFINSSANTITVNGMTISKIFEWYGSDFGNITTFINKYSKKTIAKTAKITYKEYDWNLNE